MIIAVDGPAAAGKGTLAQRLAKHLNYAFLDTGRLYRAVGYAVLEAGQNPSNVEQATKIAQSLEPESIVQILKNPKLRDETTGAAASEVAVIPEVRSALLDLQRNFAKNPVFEDGTKANGAVLDGRDIGTVVCPDADFKIYVTADTKIRANRRFKELQEAGKQAIYDTVLKDMEERDARDSERAVAPLKPAEDAFFLDTSNLDAEQAFRASLDFIAQRHA